MDTAVEWPKSEQKLQEHLNEYLLDITLAGIRTEYYQKGYVKPFVQSTTTGWGDKRERRYYFEHDAESIARIRVAMDFMGMRGSAGGKGGKDTVLEMVGTVCVRYSDAAAVQVEEVRYEGYNVDKFKQVLEQLEYSPRNMWLLRQFQEVMAYNHDDWWDKIRWRELYKACKEFNVEEDYLEQQIIGIIEDTDYDGIAEQLRDELYDDAIQEFEDEYGLGDFDERTARADLLGLFQRMLDERIDEVWDERCFEEIVTRLASKLEFDERLYTRTASMDFVSMAMRKLAPRIKQLYMLQPDRFDRLIRKKLDDKSGVLELVDYELLATLFLGRCSDLALRLCLGEIKLEEFPGMEVAGFAAVFNRYVMENYGKIRACSHYLLEKYKPFMTDGVHALCCIPEPDREQKIINEAIRFGLPIPK